MNKTIDPSESIVVLLSDDEDSSSSGQKRPKLRSECLNVECNSDSSLVDAVPLFVLNYYKVRKQQGLKVCQTCFDEACSYFDDQKKRYETGESIYEAPSSKYKPVLNIDSDEEEDLSPEEEEEPFDAETFEMILGETDLIVEDVMNDPRTRAQVDDSYKRMSDDIDVLRAEYNEHVESYATIQRNIDEMRRMIYEGFRPEIKMLPSFDFIDAQNLPKAEPVKYKNEMIARAMANAGITITPTARENPNDSSLDVVAVSEEILEPPKTLPPPGKPCFRSRIKLNDSVYYMKHGYKFPWKVGMVVNIFKDKGFLEYQIKPHKTTGKKGGTVVISGVNMAYEKTCTFRYVVGYRVIAIFKEDRMSNSTAFYAGIIAEPPKAMNRFRYLIFFDDGCAQYVPHENIRLVCEPNVNPWDDVPPDCRDFIKKYLLEYPERPMVKLQTGNMINVEYQSEWLEAKVLEVDGSLVNMSFIRDGRTEWIYRGSLRLQPLYREVENAKRRKQTGDRGRRVLGKLANNSPYVEYTHQADAEDTEDDMGASSSKPRAVARKSTASHKSHRADGTRRTTASEESGHGIIIHQKLVDVPKPLKFSAHQCGPACIEWTNFRKKEVKSIPPLQIPLHYGFARIVSHFAVVKRSVLYKAPCGRMLRNMGEVHAFLRASKSEMTVDLFEFDYWVNALDEWRVHRYNVNIPDITHGKENYPINCVNYVDHMLPVFSSYLTEREPRENVDLNLDPSFLCGCDCTDDCQDREKCSCWQLTIEGQKLIPGNPIDPGVGYRYRRLPERVITGIYECNSQCKCSKVTCLNRVVQYPLSQKLQLFKTEKKGWGIRCLNDIPLGAFICVYAGHLLTEHEANEEGKNYGDEYLAELDYIEVIESTKEGYESDVPESDSDEDEDEGDKSKPNEKYRGKREVDSPDSSPEVNSSEAVTEANESGYKARLRDRKTKKATAPPQPPEEAVARKKKKKKEELFSIRKYYGDNEGEVFIMDAKCSGNIGRYLNHSCMPNVFVQNVFVDTHDLRFPWVAFFAQTYIIAGTELTWDYHYDIGSVEGKVKYCYCGTSKCRGRLL